MKKTDYDKQLDALLKDYLSVSAPYYLLEYMNKNEKPDAGKAIKYATRNILNDVKDSLTGEFREIVVKMAGVNKNED
jgi:hypothetical protein